MGIGGFGQIARRPLLGRDAENIPSRAEGSTLAFRAQRVALHGPGRRDPSWPARAAFTRDFYADRARPPRLGVVDLQLPVEFVDDASPGIRGWPADVPSPLAGQLGNLPGLRIEAVEIERTVAV